jgi:hypothetical protein
MMGVVGAYPGEEERRIPWSMELTSRSNTMDIILETEEAPLRLFLEAVAVTVLSSAEVEANSPESLVGRELDLGLTVARIDKVEAVPDAIGIELRLSAADLPPRVALAGLQGFELRTVQGTFSFDGLSTMTSYPAGVLQRVLLRVDRDGAPPVESGAFLSVEGVVLRVEQRIALDTAECPIAEALV